MHKKYPVVYSITSFFILLCILFIPFPFYLFPLQQDITEFVFGRLIGLVSSSVFGIHLKSTLVHSDSVSMYVLALLLFVLSVIIGALFQYLHTWKQYRERIFYFIRMAGCYYLILMLMKYGLDKVFKTQFYLPEPNTLYTPLGLVDKDLLYWSSMGTSRFYNICTGSVEVMAALLVLFKRTRMMGLLLAAAAMAQVVMINFGFDISVKLYSLFLLLLSLYLLYPYYRRMYLFFFSSKMEETASQRNPPSFIRHPFLAVFVRCMVTGLILFEAFYPYLKNKNFNDDSAPRPYLHGAYEINQVIAGNDTLATGDFPFKRFFIHRNRYIIFQAPDDKMVDYNFDYPKTEEHIYVLYDYQLKRILMDIRYQKADSTITVIYEKGTEKIVASGKRLDWKKLPAIQKSFHWTVD